MKVRSENLHTVELLLSGHPQGDGGSCPLNTLVAYVVNIESRQDNHNEHVFECFYQSSSSFSDSYLPSSFSRES